MTKITGNLAPKSVVASDTGLYFAQNMMYRHTISVFDANKQLVKTLKDSADLKAFGFDAPGDSYQGAPVEAAFTSDGSYVFVSNYRMYGPGYNPRAGGDGCERDRGEHSFVYRIDTETLLIDRLYRAGPVPKYMAVTPDDRLLLVSNWCGYDVSVIDLQTHETLAEVEVGRYPRGIAVTSDGATAYVAVMGSTDVAVIDLPAVTADATQLGADGEPAGLSYLEGVGDQPRHLDEPRRQDAVCDPQRREHGRGPRRRHRAGTQVGPHRHPASQHGRLRRRDRALRGELRVQYDVEAVHQ